jgi:hypothetical protein
MRKTFCDRCEAECVNTVLVVRLHVQHTTRRHEFIDADEMTPAELCAACGELVKDALGPELAGRMAMAAEAALEEAKAELATKRALGRYEPVEVDIR